MVLLASRLGPREALAAARGWGGDAYVAFEHDGTDCARIRYRADTPADRTRMRAALVRWARKGAQPAATVTRQGDGLLLESCAVERPARTPHDRSRDALDLAVAHAEVSVALVRRGLDSEVARCGADMLVDRFDSARLTAMVTHDRLPSRPVRPCLKDAGT